MFTLSIKKSMLKLYNIDVIDSIFFKYFISAQEVSTVMPQILIKTDTYQDNIKRSILPDTDPFYENTYFKLYREDGNIIYLFIESLVDTDYRIIVDNTDFNLPEDYSNITFDIEMAKSIEKQMAGMDSFKNTNYKYFKADYRVYNEDDDVVDSGKINVSFK